MLVVIAIIAVLVAIIIPVVTNSTTKAAATNAANLRSIKAEATTDLLNDINDSKGYVEYTKGTGTQNGTFEVTNEAPTSKACGNVVDGTKATVTIGTDGNVIVKYGDNTIDMFAEVAESGDSASLKATSESTD